MKNSAAISSRLSAPRHMLSYEKYPSELTESNRAAALIYKEKPMYCNIKDYPVNFANDQIATIPAGTNWRQSLVPNLYVAEGYQYAVLHINILAFNPEWFAKRDNVTIEN